MASGHSIGTLPLFPVIGGVEFRLIPGISFHSAGSDGSIWSCRSGKWVELSTRHPSQKYRGISIGVHGARKRFLVHELVLMAFVGPRPDPSMEACHFPDRDPWNCRIDNLRWGTVTANREDAKIHGTLPEGEKHYKTKLTIEQVREARELRASGMSCAAIAKKLVVNRGTIWCLVNGRNWKSVK